MLRIASSWDRNFTQHRFAILFFSKLELAKGSSYTETIPFSVQLNKNDWVRYPLWAWLNTIENDELQLPMAALANFDYHQVTCTCIICKHVRRWSRSQVSLTAVYTCCNEDVDMRFVLIVSELVALLIKYFVIVTHTFNISERNMYGCCIKRIQTLILRSNLRASLYWVYLRTDTTGIDTIFFKNILCLRTPISPIKWLLNTRLIYSRYNIPQTPLKLQTTVGI